MMQRVVGSRPEGSANTCALTWDFSPSWDFHTGKSLDGRAPSDPLDLTLWQATYAALVLVHVVAGGGRPRHHGTPQQPFEKLPTLDLAKSFDSYVREVRGGSDPLRVAAAYVPRNTTLRRKQVIAALLTTAASKSDPKEVNLALIELCHHSGARSLDERGDVVPLETDRQTGLQARWRETLHDGAWLIGLRGAKRCLGCENKLSRDQLGGRRVERMENNRPGGRRVDYCGACTASRLSADGKRLPSLAEQMRPTHNEWIRRVLDSAEPAIL